MARVPEDIPNAEFAVISVLWKRGRANGRDLVDTLYPGGTVAHYSTIQKLLERLERKKFIKRDRKSWPHQFEPTIDREEVIGRRLQAIADKLCEGSLIPIVAQLVHANRGRDQISTLRRMIKEVVSQKVE